MTRVRQFNCDGAISRNSEGRRGRGGGRGGGGARATMSPLYGATVAAGSGKPNWLRLTLYIPTSLSVHKFSHSAEEDASVRHPHISYLFLPGWDRSERRSICHSSANGSSLQPPHSSDGALYLVQHDAASLVTAPNEITDHELLSHVDMKGS